MAPKLSSDGPLGTKRRVQNMSSGKPEGVSSSPIPLCRCPIVAPVDLMFMGRGRTSILFPLAVHLHSFGCRPCFCAKFEMKSCPPAMEKVVSHRSAVQGLSWANELSSSGHLGTKRGSTFRVLGGFNASDHPLYHNNGAFLWYLWILMIVLHCLDC